MNFSEARAVVGDLPFMQAERADVIYKHIRQQQPLNILELGIAHGVSSVYMAAALQENGAGHLTCVDLEGASFQPRAEELVRRAGLEHLVSIHRERSSYTWFLKKLIERRTPPGGVCEPLFDLCYIDGPKNWTIDGAAFFLVDKLLRDGGWIIFDDYDWTYASVYDPAHGVVANDGVAIQELADDERTTPHIEAIFRLLVMQHPSYGDFIIDGDTWAWAHKLQSARRVATLTYRGDLRYTALTRLRALYRRVRG